MDSIGKRFLKITGQVYARKTQQIPVIPELPKLVESKEVDEIEAMMQERK